MIGQIKWCALVLMKRKNQQNNMAQTQKNDFKERCAIQWRATGNGNFFLADTKADIRPPDLPFRGLRGSVELNRRQLPLLFYGRNTVLRRLRWRLPPSFITTESICRWFFPSFSVPALCLLWGGVLISHPTSNHHIDGLMGRPAGGVAWTYCIGCCPFPSFRWTNHFSQEFIDRLWIFFIFFTPAWFQQDWSQSSSKKKYIYTHFLTDATSDWFFQTHV